MPFLISGRELSTDDMKAVAIGLGCALSYCGKVADRERHDYFAEKEELKPADLELIKRYKLEVLA